MVQGTAEEWTIINSTSVAHPFHIHLNPFFIKEFYDPERGLPDPGRRWQDTIIIPPASVVDQTPGYVVIRHRFPDIADKSVLHCHILGHEDRGMMQVVEVVAKAEDCAAAICE
jgi:FtsP/CotA-like multicopper oxidase with cupredoxin domain